jgi:ferredoxin
MKILVDYDACEANGYCENIAPEVFSVDEDDNLQIVGEPGPAVIDKVREAVQSCPRAALSLEEPTTGADA